MAQIDILARMGEDALANHYAMIIPAITQLGASVASLNMRILSVSIPERSIETYEITRRGRKMSRPNGVSAQELNVSFDFRVDKYFECYKSIVNWINFIQDNKTMAMASDSGVLGVGGESEYRHDIEVSAIYGLNNDTPICTWLLEGAYPTSIGDVAFEEEGTDPITTTVSLNCMNIVYPSI